VPRLLTKLVQDHVQEAFDDLREQSPDWKKFKGYITVVGDMFTTQEEALNYVENQDIGLAYACQYKHKDIKSGTAKLEKEKTKLEEKLLKASDALLTAITKGASALFGCRICDSKIKRSFIKTIQCPVCNGILGTENQRKKIIELSTQLDEVEKGIKESTGHVIAGKTAWIIGGRLGEVE
jgi:DNA repair exonuclease SbcCD ATPase subunit